MKIGYARVSAHEQNLDLQLDALKGVGCEQVFKYKLSGTEGGEDEGQAKRQSRLVRNKALAAETFLQGTEALDL